VQAQDVSFDTRRQGEGASSAASGRKWFGEIDPLLKESSAGITPRQLSGRRSDARAVAQAVCWRSGGTVFHPELSGRFRIALRAQREA